MCLAIERQLKRDRTFLECIGLVVPASSPDISVCLRQLTELIGLH